MTAGIGETLERIAAIVHDADTMIGRGDVNRVDELRPLRLKMAGAITSLQFALNDRLSDMSLRHDPGRDALLAAMNDWSLLATEFRAFAALNQSPSPPAWHEYVTQARAFMQRFNQQIQALRSFVG